MTSPPGARGAARRCALRSGERSQCSHWPWCARAAAPGARREWHESRERRTVSRGPSSPKFAGPCEAEWTGSKSSMVSRSAGGMGVQRCTAALLSLSTPLILSGEPAPDSIRGRTSLCLRKGGCRKMAFVLAICPLRRWHAHVRSQGKSAVGYGDVTGQSTTYQATGPDRFSASTDQSALRWKAPGRFVPCPFLQPSIWNRWGTMSRG